MARGEYLDPERKRIGNEEGFAMRKFIVCTDVRMIKSIRIRWAGHVVRIEEGRR